MNETIDNPQVTEKNLAWLGGIWDGEGTISITKTLKKRGNINFQSKASIENSSVRIINEVCRILKNLNISYYIWTRVPRSIKHKQMYVVNICKISNIKKFCNIIQPHLISKIEQADLLGKFTESRLFKNGNIKKGRGRAKKFSPEEIDLCNQIQVLNKLGPTETSTTLCKTLDKQLLQKKRWLEHSIKIKSGLHGDMQNKAEMTLSL